MDKTRPLTDDLRLLVDSVGEYAIFLLDSSGHVASWNAGARNIKGYEPSEIIGQHFSRFYPPEDVVSRKPDKELEIARELGRVEDEGWRVRKDGSLFWANVVITALFDESGVLRGFGKVTRDLTQRRASEEEFWRSEQRFHLLVDSVSDYSIFILDEQGHVASWNSGARKTKGYEASEIIGKHFSVFYPPEDRKRNRPEQILQMVRDQGRFEEEGYRVRKDGTHFWANVVITLLRDDKGERIGFAKITRDLTERRAAEETTRELAHAQVARALAETMAREAEEANRIKDEFLATVSHELRTPLNAIVGWASILSQRELEPSVRKAIDIIDRNAHAQVKIIEDILDVSRIITGKLRVDPKPMDLVAVTLQAMEVVRHSAVAKQITLEFAQASQQVAIVADAERVQQVVWNLLSNAVKFTGAGGKISVSIEASHSGVCLSVTDTGLGIDADLLPFVFERFRQGDSSTTRRFGGLGLGLALVRHIAELHGGTVSAASPGRGHGSTFSVTLPLTAEDRPAPTSLPVTPLPPRVGPGRVAALNRLRVLLVDDEPDARELVAAVLGNAGADVRSAGSADAALVLMAEFRPQLLVSDVAMPDEDGYSLMRRVRALTAEAGGLIPALALTAYTRPDDRRKALAAGFTTHLGKPVNPIDLVVALGTLASLAQR
jgi:PAS domain S-box-containing protein